MLSTECVLVLTVPQSMSACLGGNACEHATSNVTLVSGDEVCNWCPEWALECEARRLLMYPMRVRREALAERDDTRGVANTDRLRAVMKLIHEQTKGAP